MGFFEFLDRHVYLVTFWLLIPAVCYIMYLFEKNSRGGGK